MADTTPPGSVRARTTPVSFLIALIAFVLAMAAALALVPRWKELGLNIAPAIDPTMGLLIARAKLTVDATMILLAVAIVTYFLRYHGPHYAALWLPFYTVTFLAFVVHLWFAIFGPLDGSIVKIFHSPSLVSHPGPDLVVAAWWGVDVLLAWFGPLTEFLVRAERAMLQIVLVAAFFAATREDKVSLLGQALGVVVLIAALAAALFWMSVRRPVPHAGTAARQLA
jgi:hypothetical protein